MRYHSEQPSRYTTMYGEKHICNHPLYDCCTLVKIGHKGLAIVQQRYNELEKTTWWSDIDPWLVDKIYLHPNFRKYFDKHCKESSDDIYPTVTVRQIMWALKMKPLKRQRWETVFDRQEL